MNVFKVEHLQKHYRKRRVVKDVSIELSNGHVVGLLGPNGAGKTTSFYMMVGLVRQDQGRIYFNQKDISDYPMHARAKLGVSYLPQEPSVFRKLTVEQNILAILELRRNLTSSERKYKLDKLLEELHIQPVRDILGMSLSGGERRRVEIARTLAIDPQFVLLDEPFAGIDPISVVDIKNIIRHLKHRRIGVLITDHNVRETLDICERAYIVHDGEIICHGTAPEILKNEHVRSVYLGKEFNL